MSKVPATYKLIDHRAPWYMPKTGDPSLTIERHVFLGRLPLIAATITVSIIALAGAPILWVASALLLASLVRLWQQQDKFTIRIPDYSDYYKIKSRLLTMQSRFMAQGPETQKLLEAVMVKAYACARAGDLKGVENRYKTMTLFIDEMGGDEGDRSDVTELVRMIEIRREMRKEGLL